MPVTNNLEAIQRVLEAAGVEFMEENEAPAYASAAKIHRLLPKAFSSG